MFRFECDIFSSLTLNLTVYHRVIVPLLTCLILVQYASNLLLINLNITLFSISKVQKLKFSYVIGLKVTQN